MKYLIQFLFAMLLISCGSSTQIVKANKKEKSELKQTTQKEQLVEIASDTLTGVVPLPKLSDKPVQLVFGSSATKLNLHLTDTSAAYQVTTNANKRAYTKTNTQTTIQKNENTKVTTATKTNSWKPPWWLSGFIVLLLILFRYLSKKFKIIKKVI